MEMVTGNAIKFHHLIGSFSFPHRKDVKRFLVALFSNYGKELHSVSYIFCSDAYLLSLNQYHLKHDTYTDVITFQLSGLREPLVAEVYISVERVKDNAVNFGVGFTNELNRVIVHGALHLCGFKDKTSTDSAEMRAAEDNCLRLLQLSRETGKIKINMFPVKR